MTHETEKKQIRERILEAIKSGHITMRPKWHFVLEAALMVAGVALLLLTILYLVSFVIFVLRENGAWFVPAFGARGWYEFFISAPWILILLSGVFIAILEVLVRKYAFAYRRPLLVSIFGIIVIAIFGGLIVARMPLHGRFLRYAEHDHLPFAGRFYRAFGEGRLRNVQRGRIVEMNDAGFVMENRRGERITVVITHKTRLPFGADFSKGDIAVVFGPREDHTVHAFGIRTTGEE